MDGKPLSHLVAAGVDEVVELSLSREHAQTQIEFRDNSDEDFKIKTYRKYYFE